MAAKKGAVSKSAGLDELKADLKAETLKNAYIFYGEETYLRQSYLDQVREALVPAGFEEFNYHRLGGKGLSMQALQEAVEAMPMMAQHTLVTVTDLDIFKLDMSARGAFIEIISDIPEYCTVIFIYDLVAYKRDGKMKSSSRRSMSMCARWSSASRTASCCCAGSSAASPPTATTSTRPRPTTCFSPAAR